MRSAPGAQGATMPCEAGPVASTMGWEVAMASLIPPMDDEPPADFIAFVAARLTALRAETTRLVGGDRGAPEVCTQVLTDLAGHWRRLCWRSRLSHRDARTDYLNRRLAARTRQWREDQIYPVEVTVLAPSARHVPALPATPPAGPADTVARRLAPLLPPTARAEAQVLAEAGIAWVHAYRRYLWRRHFLLAGTLILVIGTMVQFMSQVSAPA
jgi:hypothetical protein